MNNKQRVFIAAHKRGYTVDETRNLLRAASAPPTRSEKPVEGTYKKVPTMDEDIFLPSKDRRDISADLANCLINQIEEKRND